MKYLILVLCLLVGVVQVVSSIDLDWFCIQCKQLYLLLGQMWFGLQLDDVINVLVQMFDIGRLVDWLEQCCLFIEQVSVEIVEYVRMVDNQQLIVLMVVIFDRIDFNCVVLVGGIVWYGYKQVDFVVWIEEYCKVMVNFEKVEKLDFDVIDEVEKELDWDMCIFQDCQQVLIYVCEMLVIFE